MQEYSRNGSNAAIVDWETYRRPVGQPRPPEIDPVSADTAGGRQGLIAELIRRLVGDTDGAMEHDEGMDDQNHRIVLDVNVDGCRYVLTRTLPKPATAQDLLSPREQEISRMIAKGYPNKTIASVLDISAWTVCTHLRRIFAKLGVSSRAAMVARLMDDYPGKFGHTSHEPDFG